MGDGTGSGTGGPRSGKDDPDSDPRLPVRAFIGIGSNVGDRIALCREAVHRLRKIPGVQIKKISSLYETEPMEYLDQEWFYNAVVEVESALPPKRLLKAGQEIEAALGKQVAIPKGPRTIDLDLLFYGREILREPGFIVPHPAAATRPFVLIPLAEIAPGYIHPLLHQTVEALLDRLERPAKVEKRFGTGWSG